MPVKNSNGSIIAVAQAINKTRRHNDDDAAADAADDDASSAFNEHDVKVFALRHVSVCACVCVWSKT